MAKKKVELFIEIHNEKEFDNVIRNNPDRLICAEIYSKAFGWCTALDRLFTTIKLDWACGNLILLKVPANEIEDLQRFRDQSEPVYMFILNAKVTKVFRGVDAVKLADVAKIQLQYYSLEFPGQMSEQFIEELGGVGVPRPVYELNEPTPDEMCEKKSQSDKSISVKLAEVAKIQLQYYSQEFPGQLSDQFNEELGGVGAPRPGYELNEPTSDEIVSNLVASYCSTAGQSVKNKAKATKVFRGVDAVRAYSEEFPGQLSDRFNEELGGVGVPRPVYELNEPTPDEMCEKKAKVTKVFRGVDAVKLAEVAKIQLQYYSQEFPEQLSDQFNEELGGVCIPRPVYELNEPTPDEMEWISARALEKQQEVGSLQARRSERQAVRKRHRAELMVPFLTDLNFVLFWPHCFHAHPELYERWDANDIVMVGRELVELTEEEYKDIFYAGDAPLNEASMYKLMSGPALAICFRLLDKDVDFVPLVRRILYEEIPPFDDTKSLNDRLLKTAFDQYKTFSPTREEVWEMRKMERHQKKIEEKNRRARILSETRRLNQQAFEEALEAKKKEREQRKLDLLKAGNLAALDRLNDESVDIPEYVEPEEEIIVEEEECMVEEDEDEYFPPPGLLIPGFYAPPNDIAKTNGLAVLFPKLVQERVIPSAEFLPRHVLALLEISKRYKAIEAIAPYKHAIIHMGIFKATSPYDCVHIAYTVKQFDTLDITSLNLDQIKLAFMLSVEVDIPLLHLMDLSPLHVSRDCSTGEEECAAMFPVDYGDDYDQFEDFE